MSNILVSLTVDEKSLIRSEQLKSRRQRAITDLLDENTISIEGRKGPYHAHVSIIENRFSLHLKDANDSTQDITLSLTPLRRIIKDYSIICESYFEAVKLADPRKVEAIDMGRRGIHNEGAEVVEELVKGQAKFDFETARKIFTLIYVLQST